MRVKIISDSTCDLSADLIQKYDIGIVPLIVVKEEQEFLDGITITPKVIFEHVAAGAACAPPPPGGLPCTRRNFPNTPMITTACSM